MNKDRLKPLIEKYNIKTCDNWITKHVNTPKGELLCYYYLFEYKNKTYGISDDGVSLVLSYANKYDVFCNYLYAGYDINKLEEALKKVFE